MDCLESISENVEYPVIEIYPPEQIPEVIEYSRTLNNIVIYDDVIKCDHKI